MKKINNKLNYTSNKNSKNQKLKKNTKIKYKNIILLVILLISFSALIYSLINFINWEKDNKQTEKVINELNNLNVVEETNNEENEEIINSENEKPESIYWSYIKMNLINVDFTELKEKNKDTVAWIQVNGTNINYPVVQTKDNSYYLTHSFDKKYTDAGWVFMDYRNNIKDFDKNTIIYAHARKDRTMFGSLKNILTNDWYKNEENHIIKLSTETENTLWQVFSVYHIKTESYYITTNFQNDNTFKEFITTLKNRSALKFNANVSENDKILTLSTCYNKKEKVVLHAKLIKKEKRN